MKNSKRLRCAIYTRKSSEEGLDQSFNSLDAQREACASYIQSQHHEGWRPVSERYDDGGFSGGNLERPGLARLIEQIKQQRIDIIIVYKVDRLSRSLSDFARLVELFDEYTVSFVSVTQQFNTSTSMGRLTLNVLLSFAQFEREVTGERIRDKIAASKKKGMWMGGNVPLGYRVKNRKLMINQREARAVNQIFEKYLELQSVKALKHWLDHSTIKSKQGKAFSRGALYTLLHNPVYIGKIRHKRIVYDGNHTPIIKNAVWEKAQDLLNTNKKKHTDNRIRSNAMLSGILLDDKGNAMSPTHTKKGSKRYHYYVSQALLLHKDQQAGSIQRISLHEVDRAVIESLNHPNVHSELVTQLVSGSSTSLFKQTSNRLNHLLNVSSLDKNKQNSRIRLLLDRITISKRTIKLLFSLERITQALEIDSSKIPIHGIRQPVQWKRWGVEQKLVLQNTNQSGINQTSHKSLQEAVVKAFIWNEELQTGRAQSIKALALREKVTSPYIRRILRLAYLSPQALKTISSGSIPTDLALEELRNAFPLKWEKQTYQFGNL